MTPISEVRQMGMRLYATGLIGLALGCHAWSQPAGRKIFEAQCALCHGQTGGGGRGPALNRPKLDRAPDDGALRELIMQGYGDMPGAWQLHPDEVKGVAEYVRSLGAMPQAPVTGDATRGAAVYASRGCKGCHIVGGEGEGVGPELSAVGARRAPAFLRQTILKPGATLPDGFQYIAITPASGAVVRGIRLNEDSFTIQLRDASGKHHSFRRSEIKELRRLDGQTPMPAYESVIKGSELDDLVAYLASLKGKS
jgi:putative heme-binding domain-containing protein